MRRVPAVCAIAVMGYLVLPIRAPGSSVTLGAKRTKVNLVALPASPITFKRGVVTLGPPAAAKGTAATPTPSATNVPADVVIQLLLTGVAEGGNPVTNTANHLMLSGQLTLPNGQSDTISADEEFAISNGVGLLQAPLALPNFAGSGALEIDSVSVSDPNGHVIAVAGVMVRKKGQAKTPKPQHAPTPGAVATATPRS